MNGNDIIKDIVIITNSPGELLSWTRVVTDSLRENMPDARIIIMLVPCPYATGRETEIARKFSSVDMVFTPKDFLKFVVFSQTPDNFKFSEKGIVIFLGGDFWHAAGIAWKLKYPAVAYTARSNSGWNKHFRYILCPDERIKKGLLNLGVPKDKIKVIGNLITEGVKPALTREECLEKWQLNPDKLIVGILPGSRLYHMQDALPVFLKAAEEINQEEPNVQFIMGLSPFLNLDEMEETLRNPSSPIQGSSGRLTNSGGGIKIQTEEGVSIPVLHSLQYDLMNVSDIIITIPGTNTAECAFLGRPMVVVSSWKARIPRGGLGHLMNALPIGKLRKNLYESMLAKLKYSALPNMIAQRSIVPEVFVNEEPAEITKVVLDLIRNEKQRKDMSEQLKEVMGESGAAKKITDIIINIINESEGKK